jgi:hypothetical protein
MTFKPYDAVRVDGPGVTVMVTGAITVLRLVWPFLREVIFGRDTVKIWFKKNGVTVVWMIFIILMLVVVIKLALLLRHYNADIQDAQKQESTLQTELNTADADKANLQKLLEKAQAVCRKTDHSPSLNVEPSTYPPNPTPKEPTDKQQPAILNELKHIKDDEEQ